MKKVAHVDSVVMVNGALGRVITGAPTHYVVGGGGDSPELDIAESIGMETEDMTPAERREYLDGRFGPGTADALARTDSSVVDPGGDPVAASNIPSTLVGCEGISDATPDSFKISKHFTVARMSTLATFSHRVPNRTRLGIARRDIICNMKHVATNSLDPFVDWLSKNGCSYQVGSGFRDATNGSDHNRGSAMDFYISKSGKRLSRVALRDLAIRALAEVKMPFTQFLLEYGGPASLGWIHIANKKSGVNSPLRIGYSLNNSVSFGSGMPRSV